MYKLHDFLDDSQIKHDGTFVTVGSAKAQFSDNILCYAVSNTYVKLAQNNPSVSCVITTPELAESIHGKGVVVSEEPDIDFGKIANTLIEEDMLAPQMEYFVDPSAKIDPTAIVSPKCRIGKNVNIGRFSIIGDYSILEDNVIIGDNVIVGCEGFYFKRNKEGSLVKFLHAGGVHLHKNVEVMTGSMIQRAHDPEFTILGEGTKVSVNVNIGHSSIIGKHNMITGNVQIAGRVKIGDGCWLGTSSTISDSVEIGNHVEVKIGSVVVKNISDGKAVSGPFAISHSKNLKMFVRSQR